MRCRNIFISAAVSFSLFSSAFGHDYWIEPEKFRLSPGESTAVHLYVGDGLVKDREERGLQKKMTPVLDLISVTRRESLIDSIVEGARPFLVFSRTEPGIYIIAMERSWSYITLEPKQFEEYLREDGMEYIIPERAKAGESNKPGRERYSRFLKSMIQVGKPSDAAFSTDARMKIEIQPVGVPYRANLGSTVRFRIVFEGSPLAGHKVFADNRGLTKALSAITDKNGEVSFKLAQPGLWVVRLVHMRRCKTDCDDADWESFWGSLTFGM